MTFFSAHIQTIEDQFVHGLGKMEYAERQIEEMLPEMADKAGNLELSEAFTRHWHETTQQRRRLDEVWSRYGKPAKETSCRAIDGILDAGDRMTGRIEDNDVMDAGLIAAAQMIEYYKVARYSALVNWARLLGREDCAALLAATLAEEKMTANTLVHLADRALVRTLAARAA